MFNDSKRTWTDTGIVFHWFLDGFFLSSASSFVLVAFSDLRKSNFILFDVCFTNRNFHYAQWTSFFPQTNQNISLYFTKICFVLVLLSFSSFSIDLFNLLLMNLFDFTLTQFTEEFYSQNCSVCIWTENENFIIWSIKTREINP